MAHLFKMTLALAGAILLMACVGTNDDSGAVPYDADTGEDLGGSCDDRGGCWDICWNCAAQDECKEKNDACDNDPTCNTLMSCVRACPGGGWGDCHDACVRYHGAANDTFLSVWDCVYCGVCSRSCEPFKLECESYPTYTPPPVDPNPAPDNSTLTWRSANLTWYTSYPDPGSDECILYSGCDYMGFFSFFTVQKPESWVQANNIAAVHSKDYGTYVGKTLRVRQGTRQIDVRVFDQCNDDDCDGCCTRNSSSTGFLIDMESYTMDRFGGIHGTVEWACIDC